MSRKSEYSTEEKVKACIDFLSGAKSATDIACGLNMGKQGRKTVRLWVNKYQNYGTEVFNKRPNNNSYSKKFKESIVNEYLTSKSSINILCIKHNIPSTYTIRKWIKQYNSHLELKDYDLKPEVYMAGTLKTTLEEKIEIGKY